MDLYTAGAIFITLHRNDHLLPSTNVPKEIWVLLLPCRNNISVVDFGFVCIHNLKTKDKNNIYFSPDSFHSIQHV